MNAGVSLRKNEIGTLGAAMRAGGIDVDRATLACVATNILRRRMSTSAACDAFVAILGGDADLRAALAAEYLEELARRYLAARLEDMRGMPARTNARDGGHTASDAHISFASSPAPVSFGESGQSAIDLQTETAAAGGKPTSQRHDRREAMAALRSVAPSLFDSYRVRSGEAIGDLPWHELLRIATANAREAHVLRRVAGYARNVDPGARVRDVVPERLIAEAIEEAEHLNE